ncbi:hydrogenase [Nocardia lijiangensis]|uniref:hydrogenase n=1 Tax=Nocardia lijiangensis TaxID=299618 RepID=UPI00082D8EFD|nr:hydrogenase [Nocardia lijiangensis]
MDMHLIQLGIVLFLLGLLTGLAVPKLKNPRMGLSSHLEGAMNGMFLVIVGLIWSRLELSHAWLIVTFWLVVYAAYANWLATLLAAVWGAGAPMMPIAARDRTGSALQERVIGILLISLAVSIIAGCVLILVGLAL